LTEEAVELLVCSLYCGAQPYAVPGSAQAGFLRFLMLLAQHDFDAEPIIVDPHGKGGG
jgi:U3 small nucleolar RNA-associated protein 22